MQAFLGELPEWSVRGDRKRAPVEGEKKRRRIPVRAFFEVLWETSLRPITVGRLKVGVHYTPGSPTLTITDEIDKVRFGRELTLTAKARTALDRVCPVDGLIFGRHDLRHYIEPAAARAKLDAAKVKLISAYDLRHARATHMIQQGASLLGTGWNLGHRQATTTNKYLQLQKGEGDKAMCLAEAGDSKKTPKSKKKRFGGDSGGAPEKALERDRPCRAVMLFRNPSGSAALTAA